MSLYNIKRQTDSIDPGRFIITKFDDDLNVESSYEFYNHPVQGYLCHCPAGQRTTCRHRQMFPMLYLRCDSGWFLDFDTWKWVDPTGEATHPAMHGEDAEKALINYMEGPQGSLGSSPPATPIQKLHEPEPQQAVREPEGYEDRIAPTAQLGTHPFRRRM